MNNQTNQLNETDIKFIDIIRVIINYKQIIIGITAILTTIASIVSFLSPNVFTATATLLLIDRAPTSNLSTLLGSMGGGLGILSSQAELQTGSSQKFITLLQTRTITEAVITKLNLMPVLFEEQWDEKASRWKAPKFSFDSDKQSTAPTMLSAIEKMKSYANFNKGDDKDVILIQFTSKDPHLAAKVANTYVSELEQYLKENALSTSKRNRLFVKEQLEKSQEEMSRYELALKDFQENNKVLSLDSQTEASVKAYSDLQAKLITAEIELSLIAKSSFADDPRTTLKKQEVEELKKQLERLENGSEDGPLVSFQQAPKLGLSYARLKRELMVREKVFALLTQQYEMAKIQESQEDTSFQVLDYAIPPEKKSGPKRTLSILIALFISITVGVFAALVTEFWKHNRSLFQDIGASENKQ